MTNILPPERIAEIELRNSTDRYVTTTAYADVKALLASHAALEHELRIAQKKNQHSLVTNMCPDHRDKQQGKPCLACSIETLERKNAALQAEVEQIRSEQFDAALPALREIKVMLDECGAPTHHPKLEGAQLAKPMMPQERVRWLIDMAITGIQLKAFYPLNAEQVMKCSSLMVEADHKRVAAERQLAESQAEAERLRRQLESVDRILTDDKYQPAFKCMGSVELHAFEKALACEDKDAAVERLRGERERERIEMLNQAVERQRQLDELKGNVHELRTAIELLVALGIEHKPEGVRE